MTNNHVWTGPTKAAEGMPEDLRWIAEHVSEWPDNYLSVDLVINDSVRPYGKCCNYFESRTEGKYAKPEWLQARKDLGLIMSDEEMEMPVEEWAGSVPECVEKYSAYFKDVRHIDTLDVYRVVDLFGCEKHGHPISHAAKKLLLSGSRTGGKDVEEDVREAIDTLHRWLEMREEDKCLKEQQ